MEFQNILYEKSDTVGIVTLNRPARQNALSIALLEEMNRCLAAIAESREVKVIVIRAAGKNFCAGHDLGDLAGREITAHNRMFSIGAQMMLRLQRMPQPVIAQVHGIATAAGCQLVAACDLAVAEEGARFGTPGVNLGVFCSTPAVSIARAVGRKRALEMLFTARLISAREACEWGLVNRVVPKGVSLLDDVLAWIEPITSGAPIAQAAALEAIDRAEDTSLEMGLELEKVSYDKVLVSADRREALQAFAEKRKPEFRGQ